MKSSSLWFGLPAPLLKSTTPRSPCASAEARGNFLNILQGESWGNLEGILQDFSDPQNKGSKYSGNILEHVS